MKHILIMLFTLAGLVGMAQTNQPLPPDAQPLTALTYLSPSDSTVWLYNERSSLAINVGVWADVQELFNQKWSNTQIDSAIAAHDYGDFREFGLGTSSAVTVTNNMNITPNNSFFASDISNPANRPYQMSFPMGIYWNRSANVKGQIALGYNNTGAAYRSTITSGLYGPWNFINAPSFRKFTVDAAESSNRRNDQASIVRLNNGRMAMAYSRFGSGSGDTDASTIWVSFSDDNGYSWNAPSELVGLVSQGAYIPSFHKKANGNILMVFFVREQITPSYLSTIRAIEYGPDMSSVVTAMYTIHSGGYFPIASDRLFYDEVNNRLLMPYPFLYSGSGTSTSSVYHGGLLISDDEGATWTNTAIDIAGKLSADGYGGAVEPGIFRRGTALVYYYRTPVGNIYYNTLTYSSGTYTASPSAANIGLQAMNAQSSIKFVPELQAYVAAYTRLGTDATNVNMRKQIDLSVSYDALNWTRVTTIENADVSGIVVNAPNVFVGDKNIVVSYSLSAQSGYYDLKTALLDYAMLMGESPKRFRSFATNPLSSEHNEIAISEYRINQAVGNRVANVVRNVMDISGNMVASDSWYNFVPHQTVRGAGDIELTAFGNLAPQSILDGVSVGDYSQVYIGGFTGTSFVNGAHVDNYASLHIPAVESQAIGGTITNKWAIRQTGADDNSAFMGKVGFGVAVPTEQVDVLGNMKLTGTVAISAAQVGGQLTIGRPGNTLNMGIKFPSSQDVYFGIGPSNTIAIGNSNNLNSSNWWNVSESGMTVNGTSTAQQYRLSSLNTAPASATAAGTTGEIRITATHIYVCVATNTWVRAALTTW